MRHHLIGCLSKTGLDLWLIEEAIIFSTHNIRESKLVQISHNSIIAILAIQSHDGPMQGDLLTGNVADNHGCHTQEITSVIAVASMAEGPHPLVGMRLQKGGACANHLSPFVPGIPRSTDAIQTAMGWWEIWRCGQGSLSGCLSRAICIEDRPPFSTSIPEPSCGLSLRDQWASNQILLKESTQGLDCRLIKSRQKATKCRARRQFRSAEQSHKGCRKGL